MAYRTAAVTVSTSATLLAQAPNGEPGVEAFVFVSNPSTTVTAYVGGADVTAANGAPVFPQTFRAFPVRDGDKLYGIVASATLGLRVDGNGLTGAPFDVVANYLMQETSSKLLLETGAELLQES